MTLSPDTDTYIEIVDPEGVAVGWVTPDMEIHGEGEMDDTIVEKLESAIRYATQLTMETGPTGIEDDDDAITPGERKSPPTVDEAFRRFEYAVQASVGLETVRHVGDEQVLSERYTNEDATTVSTGGSER